MIKANQLNMKYDLRAILRREIRYRHVWTSRSHLLQCEISYVKGMASFAIRFVNAFMLQMR